MKQDHIAVDVLFVLAKILRVAPTGQRNLSKPDPSAAAADALASSILVRRMKLLYSFLGSERMKVNAALNLLASIVERGPKFADDLCHVVDFQLPAFYKVARAPR
jgi:hypothetical protein